MTNRQLNDRLSGALRAGAICDEARMRGTMRAAREALRQSRAGGQSGFLRLWLMHLRVTGWKIWLAQGGCLALGLLIIRSGARRAYLNQPRFLAIFLCMLSILAWMTAIPFAYRARRYRMREIERVCCVSPGRWLAAQGVTVAAGDVLFLGGTGLAVALRHPWYGLSAWLYLTLPFLLAGCLCLLLMRCVGVERAPAWCIAACVGLTALLIPLSRWAPQLFQMTGSLHGALACAVLGLAFAAQAYRAFWHLMRTDVQAA